MKLIRTFLVLVVCYSVAESQTTSKTTITSKATTLKSTLSTTTKSTLSTTLKSTPWTTTGIITKTTMASTKQPMTTQMNSTMKTMVPTLPSTTIFKMCRDTGTTATSGIIQSLVNSTIKDPGNCIFSISVPSDMVIQFSCSVLNFTSDFLFQVGGLIDYDDKYVENRVYTSLSNGIDVVSQLCHSNCWFDCKWTATPVPPPNMTDFKLCRHGVTGTATGSIQPLDGETGPPRTCPFYINAPVGYQIQMSCSVLNFTDSFPQSSLLIYPSPDILPEYVVNRTYTSLNNFMGLLFHRALNVDWFRCNWATVPNPPSTATDFRLCRHGETLTGNGTIQPMEGEITGTPRECVFTIIAPDKQFVRISCSIANFTSRNFLRLSGIAYTDSLVTDLKCARPEINKVYTSIGRFVQLSARMEDGNWFKCEWTTTTTAPNITTNSQSGIFKLCRDTNSTAANGTVQSLPYKGSSSSSSKCNFTIQAPPDQRIQLSCSVIDSMTLWVDDAVVSIESNTSYVVASINRVYTSLKNRLRLISFKNNQLDWIDCKWTTIPLVSENTTKFELCRDVRTEKLNGTIQSPEWEPNSHCSYDTRFCSFLIIAPTNYRVQLSCSIIESDNDLIASYNNYNYLKVNGAIDYFTRADGRDVYPLFENRVYTSVSNQMYLLSEVGEPNWAFCKWTTIPNTTTTDFKLCLDREATSTSGTIQPLDRETGKPRFCPFTINLPPNNLIFFSCSVVNLTSDSFLKLEGTAKMIDQPVVNTIYISAQNQINISSTIVNSDWFTCNWTSIKLYRICQDRKTNATTGIIQPVDRLVNGSFTCLFTISVPSDRRVQMSCADVNLNGRTSSLEFSDELRNVIAYEPVVNRSYTSTGNRMFITAVVDASDWFNCQWLAV